MKSLSEAVPPLLEAVRVGRTDIIKALVEEVQKTFDRENNSSKKEGLNLFHILFL
jgi:hypothetical protein